MPDYTDLSVDQLKAELERTEVLLQDARDERDFTAKQSSMHINASVFMQLDQDIARYSERIESLRGLLASRAG